MKAMTKHSPLCATTSRPFLPPILSGLKGLCEMCIAKGLTLENTVATFELSEAFSAPQLAKRCVLFVLEQYDEFVAMHGEREGGHHLWRGTTPLTLGPLLSMSRS